MIFWIAVSIYVELTMHITSFNINIVLIVNPYILTHFAQPIPFEESPPTSKYLYVKLLLMTSFPVQQEYRRGTIHQILDMMQFFCVQLNS